MNIKKVKGRHSPSWISGGLDSQFIFNSLSFMPEILKPLLETSFLGELGKFYRQFDKTGKNVSNSNTS